MSRLASIFGYFNAMSVSLPLSEMSLAEKLRMMEALWEDISRNSDALESPEWHHTVLQEREKRIAKGESQFMDWEQAKTDIRKQVLDCRRNPIWIQKRLQGD
jgi:hypothetical protein